MKIIHLQQGVHINGNELSINLVQEVAYHQSDLELLEGLMLVEAGKHLINRLRVLHMEVKHIQHDPKFGLQRLCITQQHSRDGPEIHTSLHGVQYGLPQRTK